MFLRACKADRIVGVWQVREPGDGGLDSPSRLWGAQVHDLKVRRDNRRRHEEYGGIGDGYWLCSEPSWEVRGQPAHKEAQAHQLTEWRWQPAGLVKVHVVLDEGTGGLTAHTGGYRGLGAHTEVVLTPGLRLAR